MSLIITETPNETMPERDIEFVSVPGRNGDIINDNNRFKNYERSYKVAALADDFELPFLTRKIKSWLQSDVGYFPLTDTYDPLYFRYACYSGQLDISQVLQAVGEASLKFNCKPFKYSFAGQSPITITKATTIINPEDWQSAPYMKITGNGDITLVINGTLFSFTGVAGYIEVDSKMMLSYTGTTLQGNKIKFMDFPKFSPGENTISFTGSVTKIEITPRWCTL